MIPSMGLDKQHEPLPHGGGHGQERPGSPDGRFGWGRKGVLGDVPKLARHPNPLSVPGRVPFPLPPYRCGPWVTLGPHVAVIDEKNVPPSCLYVGEKKYHFNRFFFARTDC